MNVADRLTQELEAMGAARKASRAQKRATFPSAPSHQTQANTLIKNVKQSNLESWTNTLANFYNRYYRGSYAATSSSWVYSS